MKIKLTIIAASILLAGVSANVYASFNKITTTETLITSFVPTKAAAYQLGMNKLVQIRAIPPRRLSLVLNANSGDAVDSSFRLAKGTFITIQERMSETGSLGYVGLVNLAFSYIEDDREN